MKQLRIAHVITKLDVGGAQVVALGLARRAVTEGHRAVVIAGTDPGTGGDLRDVADSAGVEVIDVPVLRQPIRPVDDLRAVLELRKLLRDRFDVVHTHSSKAGILGRLAAAWADVPVRVHHVHGWSFRDYQAPPVRVAYLTLERFVGRFTQRVINVSEADLAVGLRHHIVPPNRAVLLRTPVDLARFVATRLERVPGVPKVVTITRLGPPKDTETLLRAVAAMSTPITIDIVGDGPDRPALDQLVQELGLRDVVSFSGTRRDVAQVLESADAFVLSTRSEGMPTAIVEAMAAGVPVVASDVGGVAELLGDGTAGVLVPPGDPDALAQALDAVLTDEALASSVVEAATSLVERHGLEEAGRRVLALYCAALAERDACGSSS